MMYKEFYFQNKSGGIDSAPAHCLEDANKLQFVSFNSERLTFIKEYNKKYSIIFTYDRLDNLTVTTNPYSNIDKFFNGVEDGFIYVNMGTDQETTTKTSIYKANHEIINEVRDVITSVQQNRINYLNSKDTYIRKFCKSNLKIYSDKYDSLRTRINKVILNYEEDNNMIIANQWTRLKNFLVDFMDSPMFPASRNGKKLTQIKGFKYHSILTWNDEEEAPKSFMYNGVLNGVKFLDIPEKERQKDSFEKKKFKGNLLMKPTLCITNLNSFEKREKIVQSNTDNKHQTRSKDKEERGRQQFNYNTRRIPVGRSRKPRSK